MPASQGSLFDRHCKLMRPACRLGRVDVGHGDYPGSDRHRRDTLAHLRVFRRKFMIGPRSASSGLILVDCFSSGGAPNPSPQPPYEPGQSGVAHPHQPGVERPEPAVGPMLHMLGSSGEGLQEASLTVQATPELLSAV